MVLTFESVDEILVCDHSNEEGRTEGSLAQFTNRKNSKSRITEMKISFSSSSRVTQNLQITDYEEQFITFTFHGK